MKKDINRLLSHYPYNTLGLSDTHATIFFDDVEIYTVPISTANKLVNLLNDAYSKGVKNSIKCYSMNQENEIVPKIPSSHSVTNKSKSKPEENFTQTFDEKPLN